MFINGIDSISAQALIKENGCIDYTPLTELRALAKEPSYEGIIPPMQLRRLGKVIRMGIATALGASRDACIEKPEKIIIGTAYGCLADTEIFLRKLIEQEESMLTPTAFIQSTHNTVSGQIALSMSCHGHNFTYVHRGHSFEHALIEAMMWTKEKPNEQILVGGIDELTNASYDIIARFGNFKTNDTTSSEGNIPGEGASMFVVSGEKHENSYVEVIDIACYKDVDMKEQILEFLERNKVKKGEISKVYMGINGDSKHDKEHLDALSGLYESCYIQFKNLCGEYPTSTAFGLYVACLLAKQKLEPAHLIVKKGSIDSPYVLIFNHYKGKYHSLILLKML